ncbi:MAG: FAD-linked oxidase C-terminal domain-containing protein [Candidatus Accumulibacter phosphatis]
MAAQGALQRIVYERGHELGGNINAEHGSGRWQRDELQRCTSPVEIEVMRAIKRTLDPQCLMKPGKML